MLTAILLDRETTKALSYGEVARDKFIEMENDRLSGVQQDSQPLYFEKVGWCSMESPFQI